MTGEASLTARFDKRQGRRDRVLKAGIIAAVGRHTAVPCTVRNVTQTGARLRLQDATVLLTQEFELIIEIDGLKAECRVVWRKGSELGVSFLKTRRGAPRRTQIVQRLTS